MPTVQLVRAPSGHTSATSVDNPAPHAMVADNDYALGRLVDAVSHSEFYDEPHHAGSPSSGTAEVDVGAAMGGGEQGPAELGSSKFCERVASVGENVEVAGDHRVERGVLAHGFGHRAGDETGGTGTTPSRAFAGGGQRHGPA